MTHNAKPSCFGIFFFFFSISETLRCLTCGLCRSSSCCLSLRRSFSICCSLSWLLPPRTPLWLLGPCLTGALWVILCWFMAARGGRRRSTPFNTSASAETRQKVHFFFFEDAVKRQLVAGREEILSPVKHACLTRCARLEQM